MFPQVNRLLGFFLKNPTISIHLRELARQTDYSPAGARKALRKLLQEGFVKESSTKVVTNYNANTDAPLWLPLKRSYNLYTLYDAGLVDALVESYDAPAGIVLFGSYARGEDVEKSDIDIAIITKNEKGFDATKFEKVLARKINIMEVTISAAKKEFLNNLANGIVLHGYLTLIR